ncbi:hypothetical protein GGH96_005070 [Coemansia sp. RSA 1972]|nr:hypothetical protein GGH96_005070 [Coemansia sp. RSA 1972]
MYALSHLSEGPRASLAFKVQDNDTAALLKLGSIISKKSYLKKFGVKVCSDDVRAQFDALYQLLFRQDDKFIGEELADDEVDKRNVDKTIMRKIIGDEQADKIYGPQVDDISAMSADDNVNTLTEKATAKRKPRAAGTRKRASKKPKPAKNSENQNYAGPRLRPQPGRSAK